MKKTYSVLLTLFFLLLSLFTVPYVSAEEVEIMQVKEAKLNAEVSIGNIPKDAFWDQTPDGKNENTRLTKSRVGISEEQMFRVTRKTGDKDSANADVRVATIYTDRKTSVGAEAYMYYIELPEELDEPTLQFSWNVYEGDSGKQENGHPYSGTCYYLAEGTKSWVPTEISNLWFNLPSGFKGYVLFKPSDFSEIGTRFNENWQLETTHIYIADMKNYTLLVSRPFIVEEIGDMTFAAYINGDNLSPKDLFSGENVATEDAVYKIKVGDKVYSLPEGNADFGISAPDLTYLPTLVELKWNAVDNAAKYSVKLFKMNAGSPKSYTLESELSAEDTELTLENLEENQRYSVMISAIDRNGKEISTSESFSIYALRGVNFDKKPSSSGLGTTLIVIIAATAAVIIAAVIVVVLIAKKKK